MSNSLQDRGTPRSGLRRRGRRPSTYTRPSRHAATNGIGQRLHPRGSRPSSQEEHGPELARASSPHAPASPGRLVNGYTGHVAVLPLRAAPTNARASHAGDTRDDSVHHPHPDHRHDENGGGPLCPGPQHQAQSDASGVRPDAPPRDHMMGLREPSHGDEDGDDDEFLLSSSSNGGGVVPQQWLFHDPPVQQHRLALLVWSAESRADEPFRSAVDPASAQSPEWNCDCNLDLDRDLADECYSIGAAAAGAGGDIVVVGEGGRRPGCA